MTAGFLVSSIAYFMMGWATGFWYLIIVYGVFSASTHAFATVIPTQNLASTWFLKYRSRVMAVLLSASGVMALTVIYPANAWLVANATWRSGWVVIGALNVALGILAYAVIRDSPESIGQLQDGASSQKDLDVYRSKGEASDVDDWTPREAILTPQFALMLICGLGYAVPWYVLNNHGRLHLQDLGFDVENRGSHPRFDGRGQHLRPPQRRVGRPAVTTATAFNRPRCRRYRRSRSALRHYKAAGLPGRNPGRTGLRHGLHLTGSDLRSVLRPQGFRHHDRPAFHGRCLLHQHDPRLRGAGCSTSAAAMRSPSSCWWSLPTSEQ